MLDLETLDYSAVVGLAERSPAKAREIEKYLHGDLWNGGLGYDGPMPPLGPDFASDMRILERAFAPIPKLSEGLRRHVRGVLGLEPSTGIVVSGKTYKAIAERIDTAQGYVWDEHEYLINFQLFGAQLRAYGRACIRYDVPSQRTEGIDRETGQPAQGVAFDSFEDALDLICVEVPPPGTAGVYRDPATGRQMSIYLYTENAASALSVSTRAITATTPIKCAQLSFLGEPGSHEDGKTVVRILRENAVPERYVYDCGGQLLVLEARLPPMISSVFYSDSMRMLNERLNGIATMVKINSNTAGWPEAFGIELEKPTVPVADANSPGGVKEEQVPLARGPRRSPFLASIADQDEATGATTVRSGTMLFRQPVSSDPLRQDALFFEELIYAAMHQRHLTRSVAADASGRALIEWRADYADSLLETKPFVEKIIRSFLKGTACLAAYLAGDGEAETLKLCKESRWRVDCQLNAGPMSAEDRMEIQARYKAGLLSRETAIVMLGTEDIDDEIDKIEEDETKLNFPAFPAPKPTPATPAAATDPAPNPAS